MAGAVDKPPEDHPRLVLHNFISPELCKELEFIHRSCGAVGYRPGVLSTTLLHLVATNCAHLLLPFLAVRDRLKDLVEETFGCHFELFVEFTGLISWCKGARIGWHSDDNQPYLKQRDFAAVCYLNSHGNDFRGGLFHFRDGTPSSVVPVAGDVVIYTADDRNVHSVDEVIEGERLTLTLWFTRDSAHDEDAKLITLLAQRAREEDDEFKSYLPLPAPESMYWFHNDHSGFDIRRARVRRLGYNFFSASDKKSCTIDSPCDSSELLARPLNIGRGNEVFGEKFINSLHALQVLQFCYWKSLDLPLEITQFVSHEKTVQSLNVNKASERELVLPCNYKLADEILGAMTNEEAKFSLNWADLALGVSKWENYVSKLRKEMLVLFPYWLSHNALFPASPCDLKNHEE